MQEAPRHDQCRETHSSALVEPIDRLARAKEAYSWDAPLQNPAVKNALRLNTGARVPHDRTDEHETPYNVCYGRKIHEQSPRRR